MGIQDINITRIDLNGTMRWHYKSGNRARKSEWRGKVGGEDRRRKG